MNTDKELIDDIEGRFLGQVSKQEKQRQTRRLSAAEVSQEKSKKLTPIRQLLERLVNRGLIVSNCDRDSKKPPQPFEVYENDSSDSLLPGVSLFFDHPAQIEIAIPNSVDIKRLGEVVIMCATVHPDSAMLRGPFRSMREAAVALADFIAKNTITIERKE